jgi:hypothetical protein
VDIDTLINKPSSEVFGDPVALDAYFDQFLLFGRDVSPADPITDLDVVNDLAGVPQPSGDDAVSSLPSPCSCCSLPLGSCPVFIKDSVEIIHQVFATKKANQDGLRLPIQNRFLRLDQWSSALSGYWDRDTIVAGVEFGWDIGIVGLPTPRSAGRNHPSAMQHIDDVHHYVATELAHGCLLGPVSRSQLPFPVAISPLGAVPKPGSLRFRIITDCTFAGYGINAFIPKRWYRGGPWKISLPTIDDIIQDIAAVREKYPGEQIVGFRMDLSRYFRFIGVDPGQTPFLAIFVDDCVYLDLVYSFGNRGAMVAAQRKSEGVAWSFRTKIPPAPGVVNSGENCHCLGPCSCGDNKLRPYVDDFIGACPARLANHLWSSFLDLLDGLGLRPSETPGHVCPPATTFIGLGIQFDLVANTIAIPAEKLADILNLLRLWTHKLEANLHDLQVLLGKLLHVSRVVRSGRLQLSRMLDTLRRAARLGTVVPLDTNFGLDLKWWSDNLAKWNGISFMQFVDFQNMVTLDASTNGAVGGGPGLGGVCFFLGQWFKCGVPESCHDWFISDLELLAHIVAFRLWAGAWSGRKIYGLTDSEPCELLLRHGRSRVDRRLAMARTIASMEHRYQFFWVSAGIRSADNVLADCASRWSDPERRETFWRTCQRTDFSPTERLVVSEMFIF